MGRPYGSLFWFISICVLELLLAARCEHQPKKKIPTYHRIFHWPVTPMQHFVFLPQVCIVYVNKYLQRIVKIRCSLWFWDELSVNLCLRIRIGLSWGLMDFFPAAKLSFHFLYHLVWILKERGCQTISVVPTLVVRQPFKIFWTFPPSLWN